MKIALLTLFLISPVFGHDMIKNELYGSGTPGEGGYEQAIKIDNDIYHAPQYLPYSPTSATIYPRVIEVPCTLEPSSEHTNGVLNCEGYHWNPSMGRAEYLFFSPKIIAKQEPIIKEVQIPGPVIYKEVPVKKKRE